MNNLQPIDPSVFMGHYPAPQLERILAPKSIVFYVLNILTFGIYASTEAIAKKHRIAHLNLEHTDLIKQLGELNEDWNTIEADLNTFINDLGEIYGNDPNQKFIIDGQIQELTQKVKTMEDRTIYGMVQTGSSVLQVAKDVINFVGILIANVLTIGMYGVYQNYRLKNQIKVLVSQKENLIASVDTWNKKKNDNCSNLLSHFTSELNVRTMDGKEVLGKLVETDEKVKNLKGKLKTIKTDAAALKTEKVAEEAKNKQMQTELNQKNVALANEQQAVQLLKDQVAKKDAEKAQAQKTALEKETALNTVRTQLQNANQTANRIKTLETELKNFKTANEKLPEAQKLLPEIGPIPPKYKQTAKDGDINGAMDGGKNQSVFFKQYNIRYGDKRTAAEVTVAGFEFAYDNLLKLVPGGKIQLNRSNATSGTPGAFAIYNYMVLDLLKGAKVHKAGCHGHVLQINPDVSMLPSQSEKILQFKEETGGKKTPKTVFHYKQRDDFTPDEEVLELRDGVDAVSAKWILAQLSETEKEHLFNLLMSNVIENDHPELMATRKYMSNEYDPKVQLVKTAYELISDISTAISKKYQPNALIPSWQKWANQDIPAFKKEEDKIDLNKVVDIDMVQSDKTKFVKWELNKEVLGDYRSTGFGWNKTPVQFQQEDFYALISYSKNTYSSAFKNMKSGLKHPLPSKKKFDKLTFTEVNKQYYVTHQMIGATFENEFKGGERCLFSNLLAVLVTDKYYLTSENVNYLKKAMARYLDDATHAKDFQKIIQDTYHCTVPAYQLWLRGEAYGQDALGHYYYPPAVNLDEMTPLEISLAAWTVGVKIAVLPININSPAIVDENGRIMPASDDHFFGPNTEECLLMGAANKTYHGLFPKIDDNKLNTISTNDKQNIQDLKEYWQEIKKVK